MNFKELKLQAKGLLNQGTTKQKPIVVGLIYVTITLVFSTLTDRLITSNFGVRETELYMKYAMEGNLEKCLALAERCAPGQSAYIISMLISIVSAILFAGLIVYFLNVVRKNNPCFENLLDGFGFFWKVLLLNLVEGLLIGLWSCLLIVPGVIAAYRYRMAIYLLCEDPSKGVLQVLKESKQMMKGHKWELFRLDLSFIGWLLLLLVPVVCYAVKFYTVPYIGLTKTLYFEKLKAAEEAAA